jgi:hypothetical protein
MRIFGVTLLVCGLLFLVRGVAPAGIVLLVVAWGILYWAQRSSVQPPEDD